jgi:hypothetical protein
MICCGNAEDPICTCGQFVHPAVISNSPGLGSIAYRAGVYTSFRHALLLPRAGETELTRPNPTDPSQVTQVWRPGAQGDLAVQMIEWWAYLADVLTFYNERVANQAYLRTADLPESVSRLVRLLGYRPRPGIGATGLLAALVNSPRPLTLPRGFQIQSKPGPGKQPQVFELTKDVTITPPVDLPGSNAVQGVAGVDSIPDPGALQGSISQGGSVVLAGTSSTVKAEDRVLILPIGALASPSDFGVATVASVAQEKDAVGNPITRVTFGTIDKSLTIADVTQYRLLRSTQSVQLWQYPADPGNVIQGGSGKPLQIDLVSIVRSIKPNDPIVFEGPDSSLPYYTTITSTTEIVWFANPPGGNPAVAPANPPNAPIAIPHTRLTFPWGLGNAPSDTATAKPKYLVWYNWKTVGPLIVSPAAQVGGGSGNTGATGTPTVPPVSLKLSGKTQFSVPAGTQFLVEDVYGNGAVGSVDDATTLHLLDPVPVLVPPLRTLFNLLPVTRGKTVTQEILGSGNTLIAGQDFFLQNAPVTYLTSSDSTSGDNYSSTVRVWVNQLEWAEVRSFYGQPPGAQVFVTREDEQGNTHVVFGDGQNGARLPTGVNNVWASYRYGSGAEAPAAGTLTVVLQPQPGLKAIRNPVPVSGGADPDPPTKIRQLAPRSVLTFNRAVSVDDFEVIASQTPGVVRAKAAVAFDPLAQRPRVTVWVGDDQNAVAAATAAFAATADPNRLPRVAAANRVVMSLGLTIVYDRRRDGPTVQAAVHAALLDPDSGLLGVKVIGIEQVVYDSQIYGACLAVPGVVAIHSLSFWVGQYILYRSSRQGPVIRIPVATVFRGEKPLPKSAVVSVAPTTCCGQRHDPSEGGYLFVPDDPNHLNLTTEVAA